MDNPIQTMIKAGVSPLAAIMTNATCGEMCWEAREDVCRCSCGGKNHGCMKSDGPRPERTAKIQGDRYKLKAIGGQFDLSKQAYEINLAAGENFRFAAESHDPMCAGIPAKLRAASDAQMKWAELVPFQVKLFTEENGTVHYKDKPYLLWAKEESVPA